MKCVVLAGGRGEKLWPLSRKNFPKQFIEIKKNHSIFQETIARNLSYCDEFIIVTNYEYRYIISNQMNAFQGVNYRCVYEETPRKTAPAILLTCLSLQSSEMVFVVSSDNIIDTDSKSGKSKLNYKDSILKAKDYASKGKIALFGKKAKEISPRFGYYVGNSDVSLFIEKPDERIISVFGKQKDLHQNLGMLLFRNDVFINEIKKYDHDLYRQCQTAFEKREIEHNDVVYRKDVQERIKAVSIENDLIEKTNLLKGVSTGFKWEDIGQLEDLENINYKTDGTVVNNKGKNNLVYNQSDNQAVVMNDVDDLLVLNTVDAVYIGKKGESYHLKELLHKNRVLDKYADQGRIIYRQWGTYEQLIEEDNYRVRKVTLLPGKTIYEHLHEKRRENWTIIEGKALVTINGVSKEYIESDNIDIASGVYHQISNPSEIPVLFIETAIGEELHGGDVYSESYGTVTEKQLGLTIDPIIKLSPAYKDYLWGGNRIKKVFGKESDLDVIAESWELSAHPSGNSIISSGRHEGLSFSKYIENVGKEILGWKCESMQNFPVLIKFIDAKDKLSVQVHPNDDYALTNENEYGKNEMWYVIDSKPGSGLYVGFNKDTDKKEVEKAVKNNSILSYMNFYPTKPGDVFFIPAGTVHAIGEGNLICEIQQSSNCTYRLYDYDRKDKFGNKRELHLKKALDVLNYQRYTPASFDNEEINGERKIRCKYFEVSIVEVNEQKQLILKNDSFYSIICIKGSGSLVLNEMKQGIKAGDSLFIPAVDDILNISGNLSLIITKV